MIRKVGNPDFLPREESHLHPFIIRLPGASKILTIVSTLHDTDLECIQAEDGEEVGATGARPSSFLPPNKRKRESSVHISFLKGSQPPPFKGDL